MPCPRTSRAHQSRGLRRGRQGLQAFEHHGETRDHEKQHEHQDAKADRDHGGRIQQGAHDLLADVLDPQLVVLITPQRLWQLPAALGRRHGGHQQPGNTSGCACMAFDRVAPGTAPEQVREHGLHLAAAGAGLVAQSLEGFDQASPPAAPTAPAAAGPARYGGACRRRRDARGPDALHVQDHALIGADLRDGGVLAAGAAYALADLVPPQQPDPVFATHVSHPADGVAHAHPPVPGTAAIPVRRSASWRPRGQKRCRRCMRQRRARCGHAA